jgi:hypothetical protein
MVILGGALQCASPISLCLHVALIKCPLFIFEEMLFGKPYTTKIYLKKVIWLRSVISVAFRDLNVAIYELIFFFSISPKSPDY